MRLRISAGGNSSREVNIAGDLVVGRDEGCDVPLADDKASRRHARLAPAADGTVLIEDLGSTNGTFVDGQRIAGPVTLRGGERVVIGDTELSLVGNGAPATRLAGPATPQTPLPPPVESPSRIERISLRQSARRTQLIAGGAAAAVLVAVVVVVLFVTGVFGGSDQDNTVAAAITSATPSTVQIRAVGAAGSEPWGSGWVYDVERGLVVSTSAIVNGAGAFAVRLGEETQDRPAELIAVAPCDGLAVLRVADSAAMQTMPLGSQADLRQGDRIVVLGYPALASEEVVLATSTGVVSVVEAKPAEGLANVPPVPDLIQVDAPTSDGEYGGPVVALDGSLAGMSFFRTVGQGLEGQSFAIGVDRIKEVLPTLADGRTSGFVGLGLFYAPTEDQLTELDLPSAQGIIVSNVLPGSAAEASGIPVPSLLVAVDGQSLDGSLPGLCGLIGDKESGDPVTLSIVAQGATQATDYDVTVP
jgi:S1-C subfamily serine protease